MTHGTVRCAVIVVLALAPALVACGESAAQKACERHPYSSSEQVVMVLTPQGPDPFFPTGNEFAFNARPSLLAKLAQSTEILGELKNRLHSSLTMKQLDQLIEVTGKKEGQGALLSVTARGPDPTSAQKMARTEVQLFEAYVSSIEATHVTTSTVEPASYEPGKVDC